MPFQPTGGGGGNVSDNYIWTFLNFILMSAYVDTNDDGIREFSVRNTLSAFLYAAQNLDFERVQRILNDYINKIELKNDLERERIQRFLEQAAVNAKILFESLRVNLEDDNHADVLSLFVLGLVNDVFPMLAPPLNFLFQVAQYNEDVLAEEVIDIGVLVRGFFEDPIGLTLGIVFEVITAFLIDEMIIGLTPKGKPTPERQNYVLMAALKFQNELNAEPTVILNAPYPSLIYKKVLMKLLSPHRNESVDIHLIESPDIGFLESHR